MSITSILFVSDFDILKDTSSNIKSAKTSYTLWRGQYRHSKIKNLIPTARSLCKYKWKVILYMVLIGNRRLGLDILPKTPNQAKNTEDMIRTVWAEETYYWQKASRTKTCLLSPSSKEAKYMSLFIFCYVTMRLLNHHRFWIKLWVSELIGWKNYGNL